MRNSLGVLLLFAAGTAVAQPSAPRMHLVEDLRIDGAKAGLDDSPLSFLLVTPRGRMAFVELYKFRVRFFDAAGKHLGDFGSKGRGPGEFFPVGSWVGERASLTGGTVGDSIWLLDRSPTTRVHYISSQGDFLRTMQESDGPPGSARSSAEYAPGLYMVGAYADGGVLWRETFSTSYSTGPNSWSSRTDSSLFVRVPKANDSERMLARIPRDPGYITVGGVTLHAPFSGGPTAAVAPDGNRIVIFAWRAPSVSGGTFTLTAISAKGDTLFVRHYPFSGIPVDPRHADNLVAQLIRDHDRVEEGVHEIDSRTVDEFKRKLRAAVPPSRPSFGGVHIGLDNSLWLALPRVVGGTPWLILDERGEPFGTVLVPANLGLPVQFTRSNVWVVESKKDQPPSIVRYRIERGG